MPTKKNLTLYSIGHSNHPAERIVELLKGHDVAAVADIRVTPASRFSPQFNKAALAQSLETSGIAYLWLGETLGGRAKPKGSTPYTYEERAPKPEFQAGLDTLVAEAGRRRVAMLCSEREPMDCHRHHLVARALGERGVKVRHILADGAAVDAVFGGDDLPLFKATAKPKSR